MEFNAAIHGASLKGEGGPESSGEKTSSSKVSPQGSLMKFRDPADYKDMPMEERKALTAKMMGAHKAWAKAPFSS